MIWIEYIERNIHYEWNRKEFYCELCKQFIGKNALAHFEQKHKGDNYYGKN